MGTAGEKVASVVGNSHVRIGSGVSGAAGSRQWEDHEGHSRIGISTVDPHSSSRFDRFLPLHLPTRQQEEAAASYRFGREPVIAQFTVKPPDRR